MAEPGIGSSDSTRDPVELLLDEYLAARRRGEALDPAQHAARAGDRAGELRELIESAVMLEDLKGARPRGLPLHGPRVFGDYRLVAEIGRGGMGVVYEAEQITLQRRVALKVLPPQTLRNESRLLRFKREAQTAAKLHHTNIVPIFGVGEQDGVHYFVMQLIVGRPLDDVIRALRGDPRGEGPPSRVRSGTLVLSATSAAEALRAGTYAPRAPSGDVGPGDVAYYRSIASLGLQVADALTYAHAQGTLHRDIKPGNLILDAHGVLWVTDFGLAKALADEAFTGSGDLVGTLQYMAPEQLAGQADERTDVHGLGLVLYELATLRPAFAADSKGELVERVKNHDPLPPARVRPGVPRDLDTIIRKATAKDPGHRYASAAELRDDLARFLADRPIRARPVSVLESGWRWCRRNRLLASVGAVAVLGLVSTAVASAVGYLSTRQALQHANEARRLAQGNVALALQSFEDLFASVVGPDVLRSDEDEEGDVVAPEAARRLSAEDEALLEKILGFYDQLAQANRDSAEARQLTARAYHRVGEIQLQLDKGLEAVASYERAVALYGEMVATGAAGAGVWLQVQNGLCRALWRTLVVEGRVRNRLEMGEQARQEQRERWRALDQRARGLARGVIDYRPDDRSPLVRYERARAHDLLGSNLSRQMLRGFGREPGRSEGVRPSPNRSGPAEDPARARSEIEGHHRSALALNEALLAEDPQNPSYRHATARSCRLLALHLSRQWRRSLPRSPEQSAPAPQPAAEVALLQRRAVELLEGLVAKDRRTSFREELVEALTLKPGLFGRRASEARPYCTEEDWTMVRRAIEHADALVTEYPANERYGLLLSGWCQWFAAAIGDKHADEARALRRRAVAVLENLVREHPGESTWILSLARATRDLASDLARDEPEQALVHYEDAKHVLDAGSHDDRLAPWFAYDACRVRIAIANLLRHSGDEPGARRELEQAEGLLEQWPRLGREGRASLADGIADVLEALDAEEHGDKARAAALRQRFPEPERPERTRRDQ